MHPGRSPISPGRSTFPPAIAGLPKLGFFPGSTIGNFVPRSATDLLRHFRDLLGTGALLLIGMDRVKPVERLIAAYDDPEGVTAEFNLNLLERINRELDGDIPVDAFRHEARWNDMLVADRDAPGRDPRRRLHRSTASRSHFAKGAIIHTENSHKYGPRGARLLLLAGGWTPLAEWTDPAGDFARHPGRGRSPTASRPERDCARRAAPAKPPPCSSPSSTSSTCSSASSAGSSSPR